MRHADPPDWEALADRHARRRRNAAVLGVCVLVLGVTLLARHAPDHTPRARPVSALTAAELFPPQSRYAFAVRDTDHGCARGAEPELAAPLRDLGCTALVRASAVTPDGVVLTFGAASFADADAAARVAELAPRASVRQLPPGPGGVDTLRVSGSAGPFALFVVAGRADGRNVTGDDTAAARAAARAESYLRELLRGTG